MALLPTVGRKALALRFGIALIYLMLILGGVTMIYPFLITLTGAVSNAYDYERYGWYPRYWFQPEERYFKYLSEKYGEASRFDYFRSAYGVPAHWGSFRDIADEPAPLRYFAIYGAERDPQRWAQLERISDDYGSFVAQSTAMRRGCENVVPLFLRYRAADFRAFVQGRYEALARKEGAADDSRLTERALQRMSQVRGDRYEKFESLSFEMFVNYAFNLPKWAPQLSGRHIDYVDWLVTLEPSAKLPVTRRYLWWSFLTRKNISVGDYNEKARLRGTSGELKSLEAVHYPSGDALPPALAEWRGEFLRNDWPVRLCRLTELDRVPYEAVLREMFGTVRAMNTSGGTAYRDWAQVPLSAELPYFAADADFLSIDYPALNMRRSAWRGLAEQLNQRDAVQRQCPENDYQEYLRRTYGGLEAINAAYGRHYASMDEIELPIVESDYVHYYRNRNAFLRQFITYNYTSVFAFLVTKGRAFLNTLVLVALTILATLTVNPLAAYALSRFRLRPTNQILVFLLATMAFPAEVAMIPSFLLLRDFHLLNTYWALILPGLANGFSIFLLKGFFDSLPKELYEAAAIDGASEARMFRSITLPLCKPILAVIALNAFIAAYGGFMWAFLSCQNPKMWTIMVFLYQFQQSMKEYPSMVMAALVMASLPTLLVFMFCQKIILRGIIIPSMK